jgi:hypothetical protein
MHSKERFKDDVPLLLSRTAQSVYQLDYALDDGGVGVRFPAGKGTFLFATMFRPALGPLILVSDVYEPLFPQGVKRPICKDDHSLPSSVKVRNVWSYTSALPKICKAMCISTLSNLICCCIAH